MVRHLVLNKQHNKILVFNVVVNVLEGKLYYWKIDSCFNIVSGNITSKWLMFTLVFEG